MSFYDNVNAISSIRTVWHIFLYNYNHNNLINVLDKSKANQFEISSYNSYAINNKSNINNDNVLTIGLNTILFSDNDKISSTCTQTNITETAMGILKFNI